MCANKNMVFTLILTEDRKSNNYNLNSIDAKSQQYFAYLILSFLWWAGLHNDYS